MLVHHLILFYFDLCQIERRKTVETEAYWDFRALDYTGSGFIALKDALLLFQEYHADQFSLDTWNAFLESRDCPGDFMTVFIKKHHIH